MRPRMADLLEAHLPYTRIPTALAHGRPKYGGTSQEGKLRLDSDSDGRGPPVSIEVVHRSWPEFRYLADGSPQLRWDLRLPAYRVVGVEPSP